MSGVYTWLGMKGETGAPPPGEDGPRRKGEMEREGAKGKPRRPRGKTKAQQGQA
jgi:hypothetical protein